MLSWLYVSIKFPIINEQVVIIVSAHAATLHYYVSPYPYTYSYPSMNPVTSIFVIDNISHNSLNFS